MTKQSCFSLTCLNCSVRISHRMHLAYVDTNKSRSKLDICTIGDSKYRIGLMRMLVSVRFCKFIKNVLRFWCCALIDELTKSMSIKTMETTPFLLPIKRWCSSFFHSMNVTFFVSSHCEVITAGSCASKSSRYTPIVPLSVEKPINLENEPNELQSPTLDDIN